MSGLDIRRVSVRYGLKTAVDEVSAHIAPGEIVALLGPSGSGKSSLLRAIAGLEPVANGDIVWDGLSVVDVPVHRRGFGLMFQDGQLFPHRSVSGNVAFGLRGMARAERAARVASVLDLVGMSEFADRSVLSLSGGQAQRVALARSLAPAPSLLLLDEPLSALDRSLREHLSGEIRQILRTSGSTCVYVTHDQDEAFAVADVIGVMVEGRVVAWKSPQELWTNPGSRAVAEFLGFGPFVPLANGRLVAVPPGALRVVDLLDEATASSPATPVSSERVALQSAAAGESGAAGVDRVSEDGVFECVARVVEARGARGRMVVDVVADGAPMRAWAPLEMGRSEELASSLVRVSVDTSSCPTVTP